MSAIAFFIKKIVSALLNPVNAILVLLCLGLLVLRRRSTSKMGFRFVLLGAICLAVLSIPVTGFLMVGALESRAGSYCDPAELQEMGVRYIVVLGAAVVTREFSPADRMGDAIFRFLEAYRLWKGVPGAKLVLSGGSTPLRKSQAGAMVEFPEQIGVPREALVLETKAWNTEDEARLFRKVVGDEPFALVTSAMHMPRARMLFEGLGLRPVSCPCEFTTRVPPPFYTMLIPSSDGLQMVHSAFHEYLGVLWYRLKRLILSNRGA